MHNLGLTCEEQSEVREVDLIENEDERLLAIQAWERKSGKKFPKTVYHIPKLCPAMQQKEDETFRALFPFSAPLGDNESAW